jgi:AhpD family alkylhydroperoxidase
VADRARVPYLNAEDVGEADRDLLGRPINLFRALAHNPDGLRAFHGVGEWIRYGGQLDPRLRELAILRVGYVTRCAYEFSHHVRVGREFGLTDEDIELVRRPAGVDPVVEGAVDAGAAVVLQAATEITQDLGLADATWQRLAGLLGNAGAVELVLVVAHYCAVVRVLNSLKVDVEPEYEGYLREFPLDGPT